MWEWAFIAAGALAIGGLCAAGFFVILLVFRDRVFGDTRKAIGKES